MRKRAWLQLFARRSLLVHFGSLIVGVKSPASTSGPVSVVLDEVEYTRDVRGRSPLFWILLMLGIGAVGLALDKVFADNTAPYEEPPIAYIGFFLFFLCGLAFVVLCTLSLVRFWRGPASGALTPAVTRRSSEWRSSSPSSLSPPPRSSCTGGRT